MKLCKKLAVSLLATALVLLCVCALPQTAQAAGADDLIFKLNETGDGYIVTDRKIYCSGDLVIPATYKGLPVTGIGDLALSNCTNLTSVVIPDSVTFIGEHAFDKCDGLTTVVIGNSVTTIGWGAFISCASLTSVTIPSSVTYIGDGAFADCNVLTGIWVDENNPAYSSDDMGAFYNKDKTSLILVPQGTSGKYVIPDSVTSINPGAFVNCKRLSYNTYENGNYVGTAGNPYMVLAKVANQYDSTYTIHPDTEMIANYAFYRCSFLNSIVVPNRVTIIGENAFKQCERLTSITFGSGVTTIAIDTFYECNNLAGIWVEANNSAFSSDDRGVLFNKDKSAIIQVPRAISGSYVVPSSVTTIPEQAFYKCNGLTDVIIPHGVTTIERDAFMNCTNLAGVAIPSSVTNIALSAFRKCDNLALVTYCGTQEQWNAIAISPDNAPLAEASLQFHNMENGACTICGSATGVAGDIDGNSAIDQDDAVYLLLNIMFGSEDYPVSKAAADIDGSGTVDQDDVAYLLLYTMFGETYYPLKQN